MTATERLRALLDERGVEHYDGTESTLWLKDEHGYRASADEVSNGMMQLHVWCATPAQAIDATLGRGTCRALDGESSSGAPLQAGDYDEFWEPAGVCSECGELIPLRNYCPNCGRKVVNDQ